ncbi:MAG: SemiSWEET transporter [Candidatus Nanoarchaeia archaeon]|nr:SemiSWEET transporter [Candidatus Nanoarchaeia archaeon]
MDFTNLLGLVAATGSTISFMPQAWKVYRTKKTKDLSLGMYVLITLSLSGWWVYGFLQKDLPLLVANSITVPLTAYILGVIVKNLFKKSKKTKRKNQE